MRVALLLDVDDTLLRAHGAGRRALATALADELPSVLQTPLSFGGRTDREILAALFAAHGRPCPPLAVQKVLFARYLAHLHDELTARPATPCPYVDEVLPALAANHALHLSVVTGNTRAAAVAKLQSAALWPHLQHAPLTGGDEADTRADLVALGRTRVRLRPDRHAASADHPTLHRAYDYATDGTCERVIVVGDTVADVAAAVHHGLEAIAITTGTTSESLLRAAGAHHVVADFRELLSLLAD